MKKVLKYGLLALGLLLVLIAGAVSYFMVTFNPNKYKPQIIQIVKEKQQRTLKLDGDIKLTIFPTIGAKIDKISLSEHKSTKEFASVENLRVSLAVMPLLSRKIVVDEVALGGIKINVVKLKDGSSNLDDLIGKQEVKEELKSSSESKAIAPVNFDIASILIVNTEVGYRDEKSGAEYELKKINLKTGRIANGVPLKINLDAAIQANKPSLDLDAKLQTTLSFDLEKNFYKVADMNLQVKGSALEFSKLSLVASGNASANVSTLEYRADDLAISATGIKGKDNFDINVNLPSVNFAKNNVNVQKVSIKANLDSDAGKMVASLVLKEMQGSAHSFKSSDLQLDAGFKQTDKSFKLKVTTPISGNLDAKLINLPHLVFALSATGDKLPNKAVNSEMKGSLKIDAGRESVQFNLAGGLLQSKIKAGVSLKGFSEPAIRFNIYADQFDADLYMPKKSTAASVKAGSEPEQPLDLSALKKLNLDGSVRIDALKIYNVKSTKLRVDVKAKRGQVNISPVSANLYQGSVKGNIEINAAKATPTFSIRHSLNGVQLGPLIKDALDKDVVEGKVNATINVDTQGNTVSAIKKGLHGNAAMNMDQGAIKGINLGKLVHGAQNLDHGMETLKPVAGDKTDFAELKASFKINNGVAHNDDLLIKSQSLRISGSGDVDIGNSSINYLSKTTVADSVDAKYGSVTVPIQLQGPFADMKIKVDYGAIVKDVIKQKVNAKIEEKKDEVKQQLQEKLKGGLQNLFK